MMDKQRVTRDWFSKPGDSLRSLMQRRNVTAIDLAQRLEGGMSVIRGILDGSVAIDDRNASALEEAVGGSANFWLKRQADYEEAFERAVNFVLDWESDEWLDRVPSPNDKAHGSLTELKRREEIRRRLAFFNVSNMKMWESRYGQLCEGTRLRESPSFTSGGGSLLVWLRKGELEADLVATGIWNPENLKDRLLDIRKLCRVSNPSRFLPKLKGLCAEAGVAVVVVKAPRGCHASGASRLVAPDKAMILLSFRHRTDDQFWFTVFHEIGHLLLHRERAFVDEDQTPESVVEREANDFASLCVVPESRKSEFRNLSADRSAIIRFAVSLGVSPGLIVGQMQHHKMIEYNKFNSLKRHWAWEDIDRALA